MPAHERHEYPYAEPLVRSDAGARKEMPVSEKQAVLQLNKWDQLLFEVASARLNEKVNSLPRELKKWCQIW